MDSARTDESDTMRVGTGGASAVGRGLSDTERLGVAPGVGAWSWPCAISMPPMTVGRGPRWRGRSRTERYGLPWSVGVRCSGSKSSGLIGGVSCSSLRFMCPTSEPRIHGSTGKSAMSESDTETLDMR